MSSVNPDVYPLPAVRRLRVYAFDPQAAVELDTAIINDAVIELPWETRWEDPLTLGPVNEYLEIIDYDPACKLFYAPVDLNDPVLLAQNGLPPSEGRPQFHQQMVFAVAMRTIRTFERALGRSVIWAGSRVKDSPDRSFTKRLRIYPHALREANAYYSPQKTALLFGYFKRPAPEGQGDTSWVFTCLSQDIIAHETTHAILHGLQQRSVEPTGVDALAFHEAFADIVALLQRFSMTNVVEHQLAQSRGSLREANLITGLARQFGEATGRNGSLRYALEMLSEEAKYGGPRGVDAAVRKLAAVIEPHARGGVLVAAVFDAFVTIYERRVADLFSLAQSLGRPDPAVSLPATLVSRLAREAGKAAEHVLRMCVRALDYIPPIDLRFGEFLRAVITADTDLVPDDPMRYRVAFVEAFKKRGILVPGCISMAPDSLLWEAPDTKDLPGGNPDTLSILFGSLLAQLQLGVGFSGGDRQGVGFEPKDFDNRNLRELAMRIVQFNQAKIHDWLDSNSPNDEAWEKLLGLRLLLPDDKRRTTAKQGPARLATIKTGKNGPKFEVHSARIARRQGPNGETLDQLIVQVTQRREGYFDPRKQLLADAGRMMDAKRIARFPKGWADCDFIFRGGATFHVDLRDGRLRRIIRKRIDNDMRLDEQRHYLKGDSMARAVAMRGRAVNEPFAFVHRSER